MLYTIVCGTPPFHGPNQKATLRAINRAKLKFPNPNKIQLSDECKDFLEKLLTKSTRKRMTARQALRHRWLLDKHKIENNDQHLGNHLLSNIADFHHASM